MTGAHTVGRKLVAVIFLASATMKLLTLVDTIEVPVAVLQVSPALAGVILTLLSLLEMGIGFGLLATNSVRFTHLGIGLTIALTAGAQYLRSFGIAECLCFGTVLTGSVDGSLLARNAAIVLLLVFDIAWSRLRRETLNKTCVLVSIAGALVILLSVLPDKPSPQELNNRVARLSLHVTSLNRTGLIEPPFKAGRAVVLALFSPRCSICRHEALYWNSRVRELETKTSIKFFGLSLGDSVETARFSADRDLQVPLFTVDPGAGHRIARDFQSPSYIVWTEASATVLHSLDRLMEYLEHEWRD